MSRKKLNLRTLGVVLGIWWGLNPPLSSATVLDVSLDTSSLSGSYSVVFDLIGGSAASNNSVTISNFSFSGGGPSGGPTYTCTSGSSTACLGVIGDISSLVNLTDANDFFNEFVQGFTPGTMLKFRVNLTTNFAGVTPDLFAFSILDSNGNPIPTHDPLGTDALLSVNIASPLSIQTFASPSLGNAAPEVKIVPEPDILALLIIGVAGLKLATYRRKIN